MARGVPCAISPALKVAKLGAPDGRNSPPPFRIVPLEYIDISPLKKATPLEV